MQPRQPGRVCATYRPSSPLSSDNHALLVYLEDDTGTFLARADIEWDVDTTAPRTTIEQVAGSGLRPTFAFSIGEDDPVDAFDSAQCSFGPFAARPVWKTCATKLGYESAPSFRVPRRLPRRHVDYRFRVRAMDDFGRVDRTPSVWNYDPVPCAIRAHDESIGKLISSGIPLKLRCSFLHAVALDFFLLAKNGGRRSSIAAVTGTRPNLGYQTVRSRRARYTVHRRLRLFSGFAPYFRTYRSAVLVIRAQDPGEEHGLPAYAVITVRR